MHSSKIRSFLKSADGALGGHIYAVQERYKDFTSLATTIARMCEVTVQWSICSKPYGDVYDE